MEQAEYAPRPSPFTDRFIDSQFSSLEEDLEKVRHQIVYGEALTVGGDWLEATNGKPITPRQYRRLYDEGYASHSPDEILEVFSDWDDFSDAAGEHSADRQRADAERQKNLLDRIHLEKKLGLIPAELFQASENYTIDNPKPNGKPLWRSRFTEGKAGDIMIISRYCRYVLADHLASSRRSGEPLSEARRITIALGFNKDERTPVPSFLWSIKNSVKNLTDNDVKSPPKIWGSITIYSPIQRKII